MDIQAFRSILIPSGQEALQTAQDLHPREEQFLTHFSVLSRRYPVDLARSALDIAILRDRAVQKFPFANRMYFTREALEQASSFEISTYRAERFRDYRLLVDLGCSVGGDTLAFASLAPTIGVDLDPLRLVMSQANVQALGLGEKASFLRADLNNPVPLGSHPSLGLFFDPARRAGQKRIFSVKDYQPPLEIIQDWLAIYPALGVKISPGVDISELRNYDAEVEFISLRGELKEAVLWFGPMKTSGRRATVLPGPHTLWSVKTDETRQHPTSEPRAYLYEPDPAVLRAGLVMLLSGQLDAIQLDPSIAYLTSDHRMETPFARSWQVENWFPFNLKRLRNYLRERNVGQVVVKKRGSPLQPEELIHALRLKGENEKVVVLTQLRGRPIAIICTL